MIVILNNGTRIKIADAMAQAVCKNLLNAEGGARQWQWQLDGSNNGVAGFNLHQVSAICEEEDVLTTIESLTAMLDLFKDSLPNKDESGKFWADKFRQFLMEKR
jgi:hypothetical protein